MLRLHRQSTGTMHMEMCRGCTTRPFLRGPCVPVICAGNHHPSTVTVAVRGSGWKLPRRRRGALFPSCRPPPAAAAWLSWPSLPAPLRCFQPRSSAGPRHSAQAPFGQPRQRRGGISISEGGARRPVVPDAEGVRKTCFAHRHLAGILRSCGAALGCSAAEPQELSGREPKAEKTRSDAETSARVWPSQQNPSLRPCLVGCQHLLAACDC
mmetsp:Transcript_51101/g.122346  ORF Transcript_51101/g.122346 Transcript_51101/m.122346 type:complete len:210 (-) Transcript_51101:1036-1665(-)